ncbi:proton-coupled folate transporter-like [Plutella xylostella]|uniref:proton-coupled folate transporter-like n=1 Tax=Plutella xylostella TaxID=51655 RepID=UPI002032B018|nr:proton-coupled folate transporter-like [Plutella xylostella]
MTVETKSKNHEYEEKPLQEKHETKCDYANKSFFGKIRCAFSNITVEPILAGIVIPSMLARLAIQNLNLDKACRVKLQLGDEICDNLIQRKGENLSYYEADVQRVITSIESWRSIISTGIPMILVIFMGAWSDRTGNRKLCILLPIFGEFMVSLCNILSTNFFYEIPVELTMFLEVIFPAVTGGWVLVLMGVFSYISDITTDETRTFRVGLVNLCLSAGIPIGTAVSGILLKLLGYYGVFIISTSIYTLVFMYGYFYLKDRTKPGVDDTKEMEPFKVSDVISLTKETAEVAFKERKGNLRMKVILSLIVVSLIYGPDHGERNLTYMFVRYRLQWDAMKYSMYSTYGIAIHSLSCLFCISVFSRRWGLHDSMLCLISVASKCAGSIMIAFVQTDFQMFMVPLVEILNSTTFTCLRSMASKLVEKEEMGKMNSLFSLVETLAALVFDPAYSAMYFATLSAFTGAVFLFSASMTVPAMLLLIWFFWQHRKETRQKRLELIDGKEDAIEEIKKGRIPQMAKSV